MSILSTAKARILARPIGNAVADNKLQAYIDEVEQTRIAAKFGSEIYIALQDAETREAEPYKTLLKGGTFMQQGRLQAFFGLEKAIAYGVYCKMMQSGDIEVTRYGTVLKRGEYSDHATQQQLAKTAGEVAEIEHRFVAQCLQYCRAVGLLHCCDARDNGIFAGGIKVGKIKMDR